MFVIKNLKSKLTYFYYALCGFLTNFMLSPRFVFADDPKLNVDAIQMDTSGKLQGVGAGTTNSIEATAGTFNTIFANVRVLISGATGLMSIVLVAIFAYKAFTLSRVGDKPKERAETIQGMIFFFIGAACFGAASLLTGLFYNILG